MHWFTNVILTSRAQATSCVINLQELRHTLPQVVERPKVVLCHHMPCFSCHLVPLEGLVEVDLHSLPLTVAGNYCIMCNPPLIVTLPLVFYVYIYIYTIYIHRITLPTYKGHTGPKLHFGEKHTLTPMRTFLPQCLLHAQTSHPRHTLEAVGELGSGSC